MTHRPTNPASEQKKLRLAFMLTAAFMGVEAVGGVISGSLALLADAAHMLTDAASLALALWATGYAMKPADAKHSFGHHRARTLAAFINGMLLIALSLWITAEAIGRLMDPRPIEAGTMMVIAALGLVVNIVVFRVLHPDDGPGSLNTRAARLHVLGDLLGSIAALLGGTVIWLSDGAALWLDPVLSLLIAGLLLRSAAFVCREAGTILLESTPPDIDVSGIAEHLQDNISTVRNIHHVHVWMLTEDLIAMTLHARLTKGADADEALKQIIAILRDEFDIHHATVQIEYGPCPDSLIDPARTHA
ncbi:MAG: CDF family zinc transporter ZitB [Alphaproteobacteria bacterium]